MPQRIKEREIEILKLMADHHTNREISEELGIGVETVRWYAKQIYAKLYVSSRKEAVAQATELGILDAPVVSSPTIVSSVHNLPRPLNTFIGRQSHLQAIADLLQEHRLITLVGTGGTGKTRLSIETAYQVMDLFSDGIYFVDLFKIRDSQDIPNAIAEVLAVAESDSEDTLQIVSRIIANRQILLILDNFEHLIEGAPFIHHLLTMNPNLCILVTSREILSLSGEQAYPVPPLSIQADSDEIPEAVALFVERAQLLKPSFQLTEQNQNDIQFICERVDGLPLAIELLAAHVKLLTPQKLRSRIVDQLVVPASSLRDIPERHRTLNKTIGWSYEHLSDEEQILFSRLSIFSDGRSLEAIEAICMADLILDMDEGLLSLLDKSMIQQIEDGLGDPRFILLETLSAYAQEQLIFRQEHLLLQRNHANYYMDLVERAAPELRQANQEYWFKKLAIEYGNLRVAMTWALSGEATEIGCRIVIALRDYWWYQGLHRERWHWIEQALVYIHDLPNDVRADLWLSTAYGAYFKGDFEFAGNCGRKAFSLYQSLDNRDGMAWSYTFTGIGIGLSMVERAKVDQQAVDMMRENQNLAGLAMMLNVRGLILVDVEAYDEAVTVFEECYQVALKTGERRRIAIAVGCLGEIALRQGLYSISRERFLESLRISRDLHFVFQLHDLLWMAVALLYHLNQLDDAMLLFGAVRSQEQLTGQEIYPLQNKILADPIQNLQDHHDQYANYRELYQQGYALTFDEAIDFALDKLTIENIDK